MYTFSYSFFVNYTIFMPCRVLPVTTAGLLIDWLKLLDPEIISTCPGLQQKLLFAKEQIATRGPNPGTSASTASEASDTGGDKPVRVSNQPYLLSLLTHQGSWTSIHKCINLLLGPGHAITSMSASSVLDFLWACIHIPTIWQGRDKKLPKVKLHPHLHTKFLCPGYVQYL